MRVSIIVPVYNEANTIKEILAKVESLPIEKEVVVVNDGSTDGTQDFLLESDYFVLHQYPNAGKTKAIAEARDYVTGDVVVIQDADLEYDPQDITKLLWWIERGQDVVYGSRFLGKGKFLLVSYWGNKAFNFLIRILYGVKLTDMGTGYKCIKTELFKSLVLHSNRFGFDAEVTCQLLNRGIAIKETPITYQARLKGKKITIWDGFKMLGLIIKYCFKKFS